VSTLVLATLQLAYCQQEQLATVLQRWCQHNDTAEQAVTAIVTSNGRNVTTNNQPVVAMETTSALAVPQPSE